MKKFYDKLNEATTLSSGGYTNPGDGSGITGDDDLPTGTTVFGDKMVPVVVNNRLTGKTIKYVPAEDLGQGWNYDEFENSSGMGSIKGYSTTLLGLRELLGKRLFKHAQKEKLKMQTDKWDKRSGDQDDSGTNQTAKISDDDPSKIELSKGGTESEIKNEKPETNDHWREVPMKHIGDLDIMEKINNYLGEPEEMVNEVVADANDRKLLAQAIIKGKNTKISIKSLGVQAIVTNSEAETIVTYQKNEDFTLILVDIADTLGMEFKLTKDGGKQAFRLIK